MFGFIVGGGKSDFHENWRRQNRLFSKRKRNSRSSLGCSLAEGAGTADRKRKRESKPASSKPSLACAATIMKHARYTSPADLIT